ncbi:hypothetical protein Raf01_46580 [Rugosimonospora africana]|uniref:Uncharacterized protein n=1 Tax=Rugosimonospora africana TaxID=556532 RepID=A0A8J3QU24_9ACTN|nr:hypothetical protein Raf01_46580 [Rugosimonospora africana]
MWSDRDHQIPRIGIRILKRNRDEADPQSCRRALAQGDSDGPGAKTAKDNALTVTELRAKPRSLRAGRTSQRRA